MSYEHWNRQLKIHQEAVELELESLTQARIAIGSASLSERLGYHFPWIFRKWAQQNAEVDEEFRQRKRQMRELREKYNA